MKLLSTLILLFAVLLTNNAISQELPGADARAQALAIPRANLPVNFQLSSERIHLLPTVNGEDYLAVLQGFNVSTPDGPLYATFVYAAFDTKQEAHHAFSRYPASSKVLRVDGSGRFDGMWGVAPFETCVLRDRAVVYLSVRPQTTFSEEVELSKVYETVESYLEPLLSQIDSRLENLGYTTSPSLILTTVVDSSVVTQTENVQIKVEDEQPELRPLNFSGEIRNTETGDLVFEFARKGTTQGQETFTWSGRDQDDELVPDGNYNLAIGVADVLGRRSVLNIPVRVSFEVDTGGTLNLITTKDSTLRAKKPNRNEGANPRLFLSHRLEARGKSQNPIVGFELANEDLTGLTKATLVMNVQDCDLPRRWGRDGRYIIACPVNEPWVEGNGNKYRVNGGNGKTKGQGPGVTWFSPVDDKIQNNRPNGSMNWNGARTVTGQPTAPPVLLTNRQTGNVEFDVTQDVLAGYKDGWVLKKQDESKFGNIRFYSKEGAAGNAELTPRLILEFGGSTAKTSEAQMGGILAKLGFGRGKLERKPSGPELPSFRERLQKSPVAALAGETLVGAMAGPNPALKMASQVAYRAWLEQGLG